MPKKRPQRVKPAPQLIATDRPPQRKVLIRFRHGLGDAVQLTIVLQHLKRYHPEWAITVKALHGKTSAVAALCNAVEELGDPVTIDAEYDEVHALEWPECHCDFDDAPNTKPTRCLREVFKLRPIPNLCNYKIEPNYEADALAKAYLQTIATQRPHAAQKFNTVIIHYQGNTSSDKKDLPEDTVRVVCQKVIEAGLVPIILDWDDRSRLPNGTSIFCPDKHHDLWQGNGTGDAATIASLIEASTLMIGVDSGPLHVAGATTTPTIAVWTHHHPVHYFDLADNVLHFVPGDNEKRAGGPRSEAYFQANYRHQVYKNLNVELPALVQSILTGESFEELANQRFLTMLTSKAYDRTYYEEHRAAGLDYLGHGGWQEQYARWLTDSLAWNGRTVLDVGCACGSIVQGLGKAGAVVQGVDINEYMITLGRTKWPDMQHIIHTCDAVNLHLYADQTFDGLHSAQVAEHWKPALVPAILQELARVTKDNGLFFCALDTTELFARQCRNLATEDPTHVCVKSIQWWYEQLHENGWDLCSLDFEQRLLTHPESFFKRYDWDWFVARRRPATATTVPQTPPTGPRSTSTAK